MYRARQLVATYSVEGAPFLGLISADTIVVLVDSSDSVAAAYGSKFKGPCRLSTLDAPVILVDGQLRRLFVYPGEMSVFFSPIGEDKQ